MKRDTLITIDLAICTATGIIVTFVTGLWWVGLIAVAGMTILPEIMLPLVTVLVRRRERRG